MGPVRWLTVLAFLLLSLPGAVSFWDILGTAKSADGAGGAEGPNLGAEVLHPVCWRSSDHGGFSAGGEGGLVGGIPGVAVFGSGCSVCVAGATCSFSVTVMPPASWAVPASESQKRELNVVLTGPAKHAGLVGPTAVDDSSFLVTYRTWDSGKYRVSLRSSCGTLNYTSDPEQETPHELASWTLVVLPGPQDEQSPQIVTVEGAEAPMLTSPCAAKEYGRWLNHSDGEYRWTPYPCAGPAALDPTQWIAALNQRGIYEIVFVGDSHQRMLVLHLRYLLTGRLNQGHRGVHKDFSYAETSGDGKNVLRLIFYWVGGIYKSFTFGCSQADRSSAEPRKPSLSTGGDVFIFEAGYWTGQECREPEAALSAYLPHYLFWAREEVTKAADARPAAGHKRQKPLFVYRPTPPRASEELGCHTTLTNKYVRAANSIERVLIPHFGATVFNSWEIEAARFTDNCANDHHYSCAFQENGKWAMRGDVGKADVYALIHFLLNN